jgi:hypothetical protein
LEYEQTPTPYVFRESELTAISGEREVRLGAEDVIEFPE